MAPESRYARERERMVERQIAARGVRDAGVLRAMRSVPREEFVDAPLHEFAYEDAPLPIGAGQTISQPYIVALMIEAAQVRPGDRVLEIGAGSGYAAAVMAKIAAHVHAIERQPELARIAQERFDRLGFGNITLKVGDGTCGWPEHAPFDAILAAAGGPEVPGVLLEQLAPGGRLVLPVGTSREQQRLVLVGRTGDHRFEQSELGAVRFVPLIGEHGWQDVATRAPPGLRGPDDEADDEGKATEALVRACAEPLRDLADAGFGALFDRFGQARVVLLGEASHGTSEFYRARAAITRRLVEQHGFRIIAVEADWPDAASIDRYVRHRPPLPDAPQAFQRFPAWMWRNAEVQAFVEWLRGHNTDKPKEQQAGFHGLDLYSLNNSIRAVVDYLDRVDPQAAAVARRRYACLTPWSKEPAAYGKMALTSGFAPCEQAVLETLRELLDKQLDYARHDGVDFLDAAQNARLVANAEAYYRAMYYGSAESWNLRDTHMFDTLKLLLAAGGADSKAVVWAHNSHIGDARHTEMGQVRGEINIGQLCRQEFGDAAALIGFGTHTGTVAAASDWDAPMRVMRVNPSLPGSCEREFHDAGVAPSLFDMRAAPHDAPRASRRRELRAHFSESRLERFIGVVYRPETERWSHYAECELSRQFDAWVWFDRTQAVTPLADGHAQGMPETYPFGV
jgi:protein-L-isoaspartate(D-aspartate) O-methyltransferase